jgi:hypothetical protein
MGQLFSVPHSPQPLIRERQQDWAPWVCLVAFVAFTATVFGYHEMWRDEVRPLFVAANAGSWLQLVHNIHEEGHPVLWYAVLRVGYGLTHSTLVLPVASIAIAAAAAFLMLRFAPFPFWMRVLAVFGAFLGYQYSIIVRNYGIGILLMFTACIFFSTRHEKPIRLGIILALLGNTSPHAALATFLFLFVWLMDVREPAARRFVLSGPSIAAICVVIAGTAFGLWSAHAPPDSAFAFSLSKLRVTDVLRTIAADPGLALMGAQDTNIAAAEWIPWASLGLNPELTSRVIVDIALASIAWSLRRNLPCLIAAVLAVFGFEVVFQHVYGAGLRHEGILAFTLISLCWIATTEAERRNEHTRARSIPFGLIPLIVVQAAALPWIVKLDIERPRSSSKAFGQFIRETPRLRNAVIMGDPDYLMEPMSYYVRNRIFFPRQHGFDYRTHFDHGAQRDLELRLGALLDVADSLACANRQPVLLAMGEYRLLTEPEGESPVSYVNTFRWNASERSRLFEKGKLVFFSFGSFSREDYSVFEIPSSC